MRRGAVSTGVASADEVRRVTVAHVDALRRVSATRIRRTGHGARTHSPVVADVDERVRVVIIARTTDGLGMLDVNLDVGGTGSCILDAGLDDSGTGLGKSYLRSDVRRPGLDILDVELDARSTGASTLEL